MDDRDGRESSDGSPDGSREEEFDRLYLAAVINSMADPVTVITPDYRVVLVNRRAKAVFGDTASRGAEMHCHQISHRSDIPCSGAEHPCPMQEVRTSGRAVKVLHEHYDLEDRRRYVEIAASPFYGTDGEFGGIVESHRDVTDRILAERKLAEYSEDLKRSNRMKNLFIDIMRHDLMNPAWLIRTAADHCLKTAPADAVFAEDLQMIERQARRVIDMLRNASTLATVEGGLDLSFEDIDLAEMAEGAVADYMPAAGERNMQIDFKAARAFPIRAHPSLYDVFSNLISNALKYGEEGSPVTVAMAEEDGRLRVTVTNRGEGIPAGERERIFTRFTRVDKGGVKGTGLGLEIVKRIVKLHDGRVWVEDNPDGGSVFVVQLPCDGPPATGADIPSTTGRGNGD